MLTLREMTRKVWKGLGVIIGSPQCSLIVGVVRVVCVGLGREGVEMSISIIAGMAGLGVFVGVGWFRLGRIHALSVLNRVGGYGG